MVKEEKQKALEAALAQIEKQFGKYRIPFFAYLCEAQEKN